MERKDGRCVPNEMQRCVPNEMQRCVPNEMQRCVPNEMQLLPSKQPENNVSSGPYTAVTCDRSLVRFKVRS